MTQKGDLVSLAAFNASTQYGQAASWMPNVLTTMRSWVFGQPQPGPTYVVMQTVKEIARHVLQDHYQKPISSRTDHLLTFSDFRARYCHYKTTVLTDQDIWLVIRYLHQNAGVAIADDEKCSGSPYMVCLKIMRTCCIRILI